MRANRARATAAPSTCAFRLLYDGGATKIEQVRIMPLEQLVELATAALSDEPGFDAETCTPMR